jgi:hypothetical protein
MSDPAEIIVKALREAQVPADSPTRLATVTATTPATVTVTFDGDTTPSSRAYVKAYGPSYVGDRAIMLRTGSTWVAIGRLAPTGGTVATHDTGWNDVPYQNGWFSYDAAAYGTLAVRVINGVTYMRGLVQNNSSANAGAVVGVLPVGSRPGHNRIFTMHSGGGPVNLYVFWTGVVQYAGNSFWGTWLSASVSFPAEQ